MVDVGHKAPSRRRARARCAVRLSPEADELLRQGNLPKGSPLEVTRLAALQAAKQTSQLIPLCHPLRLTSIQVEVLDRGHGVWWIEVTVEAEDRTGVEMEAMTGAAVGGLALYDMVKAVDRSAALEQVVLLEKSGGKSGDYRRDGETS